MTMILLILVVYSVQGFTLPLSPNTNGEVVTKVIGGKDAPDGAFPYQVSLRTKVDHFCGGSILNKRWILTAAHCLDPKLTKLSEKEIIIVVGTNSRTQGGDKYYVKQAIRNDDYDNVDLTNDIGLIEVTKDIQFNDKVQPISLPDKDVKPGDNVLITGWGRSNKTSSPINLQMINQTVIELDSCEETYEDINEVSDTVFCSTIVNSNQPNGACQGDSGGPVVANNKLQGLVSWGLDCEEKGFPDVNTNVYLFNDWINQHINK